MTKSIFETLHQADVYSYLHCTVHPSKIQSLTLDIDPGDVMACQSVMIGLDWSWGRKIYMNNWREKVGRQGREGQGGFLDHKASMLYNASHHGQKSNWQCLYGKRRSAAIHSKSICLPKSKIKKLLEIPIL